ncbi:MAG: translation initiation factor IF-2 [Bacteroidota bacterium]|nr:translation initiation factor IF-2 [Bacteroidota bacterium]
MSEGTTTIRLSKAAREFNIGVSTIVDFLSKKGHVIKSDPNTKLSQEEYSLLMKEFATEKHVKEEANKIGLQFTQHETITIDDKRSAVKDKEKELEDLFIKNVSLDYGKNVSEPVYKETSKKEPVKEKKVEPEISEIPKVVEKEQEPETPVAEPVKEEVEIVKEQPVIPEKKKEEPIIEEVLSEPVIEPKPEIQEKKAEEKIEEKIKERIEEKIEEKEEEKTEKTGEEKKEEKEEEKEKEEKRKTGTTLKILGKLDLEAVEKKPSKKTPAKKETVEKEVTEKEITKKVEVKKTEVEHTPVEKEKVEDKKTIISTPAEKKPSAEPIVVPVETAPKPVVEDNFIRTETIKLEGPTILGSMTLPEPKKFEKKKPVASSSDETVKGKKKKRKRIKKQGGTGTEGTVAEKRPEHPHGKPHERKSFKEVEKPELNQEDIQRQIKETLARLGPSGKSKASKYRRLKREAVSHQIKEEQEKIEEGKKIIKVTEFVTANELANMMNVSVTDIISTCMSLGLFVSINQRLDAETLTLVADEFGYKVEFVSVEIHQAILESEEVDTPESLVERPPIITVMGHVDHGKTKLLDYVRKTNVVAGEAGGITQHIGAYLVTLENGKTITFLDTPGHEAFTAMRARGAKITDVAIIVIAADDSVMPQTREAINHALAAGVPIVFAINKIDKPNANPDKVREELAKMNILVEEWGGKYQTQEISAKLGTNVNVLLEKVLVESELLNLKANPNRLATGTVIESSLDKGRGYVATVLVQNGTLKVGDIILAGANYGKVKAMYNERNLTLKEAGPSSPALILGLNGAPQAGDTFNVMTDEKEVKAIANKRMQLQREQGIRTQKHITLDEIGRRIAIGDFKELNIIVKGDVDGSVEALSDSLIKLSTDEVVCNVIHKSVGQITESDVLLASASNAIIVGFQVRPSLNARKLAEQEQIDIRLYSIIYNAIEEIKAALEGMLSPEIEEKITCNVEVREVFKISKVGTVAGCYVLDGKIVRNSKVRIIRDGIVVYTGTLGSLKRFKDDVKDVPAGYECGLNIENFNDIKVSDIIEGYEEIEVKRKL